MVYKEELCTWFKHLSPHKRVDFMCGMLHMCLPMELRFLGSFVEDLAKKDFHNLRESEGKANSRFALSKFSEVDDKTFRTKMAVYLALLHSSNRICSNIIYELLENHVQKALDMLGSMDEMTIHNILLILSMAMNHPAFSFNQKAQMYNLYTTACDAADQILNKVSGYKAEQELLILSESCDTRSCDQRISPMCSPHVHLVPSPVAAIPPQHVHNTPATQDKVHVCDIEVKGSRSKESDTSIMEYLIQVTWSNGEKRDVYKTYQELVEFNTKLQQNFKQEVVSHSKFVKIPVIHNTQNHKQENTSQLNMYMVSLVSLPEPVKECSLFTTFFGAAPAGTVKATSVQMADASTSPRSSLLQELPLPVLQNSPNSGDETPSVIENCRTIYLSQSPINGEACSLSPQSPAHHGYLFPATSHSPSISTKTASPLICSSPCQSPASSLESLARSPPNSPPLQGLEPPLQQNSVPALLKSNSLAIYADNIADFTLEQLCEMSIEEVENLAIPRHDADHIKRLVDIELREKSAPAPLPNGLIYPTTVASGAGLVSPAAMWTHPPHPNTHMYPPIPAFMGGVNQSQAFQHMAFQHHQTPAGVTAPPPPVFPYPTYQPSVAMATGVMGNVGVREASPSNSEYSSPSQSPHLPHTVVRKKTLPQQIAGSDSSSDDGDRERQLAQHKGINKWKGHSAPSSARCSRHDRQISLDASAAVNNTSGTDKPEQAGGHAGSHGNSGYTSDPTFTRRHKAQPAHTNMSLPQTCVISMPDNSSFKVPPQPVMPPSYPHINPLFGEMGQHRPVYMPNDPSVVMRSHFSQMNGGSRPFIAPSVLNPNMNSMNHSVMQHSQSGSVNTAMSGSVVGTGKGYAGTPGVLVPVPTQQARALEKSAAMMNGNDNNCSQSSSSLENISSSRSAQISSSCTASSASVTVTYTSASQTLTTSHSSCRTCGCSGHNNNTQQTPSNNVQYMPQVWHAPYPNGLMPMHPLQQFYLHPNPFMNGLNQDVMYNQPVIGMPHSANQAVGNGPNVIYGNYCNNYVAPMGGYNQRRPKKLNCHNCGSSKHAATDCTEGSMESMSGPLMYSYKPKNDSD